MSIGIIGLIVWIAAGLVHQSSRSLPFQSCKKTQVAVPASLVPRLRPAFCQFAVQRAWEQDWIPMSLESFISQRLLELTLGT